MEKLIKDVDLIHSVCFFMKNYTPFCSEISFHQRKFVILSHSIKDTEFTVKIDYGKEEFDHLIHQYVSDMIKVIRENQILRKSGWMNDTVFVNETDTSDYFGYCVFQQLLAIGKK